MFFQKPLVRFCTNLFLLSLIPLSFLNKITGNVIHEMIGLTIILLIGSHTFLNVHWYGTFFQHKNRLQKVFNTIIIALLIVSFGALIISSLMISKSLFSFLGFKSTLMLRQIHTTSAYWFFMFGFIHLGIHWQRFRMLFKKVFSNTLTLNFTLPYQLTALFALLVSIYAGWIFVQRDLSSKLFMTFAFEFWDDTQAGWKVFLDYVILMSALVMLTQYVQKWVKSLSHLISTFVCTYKMRP